MTTTVFLSIITFVFQLLQLYLAYVSRAYEMFPKYNDNRDLTVKSRNDYHAKVEIVLKNFFTHTQWIDKKYKNR